MHAGKYFILKKTHTHTSTVKNEKQIVIFSSLAHNNILVSNKTCKINAFYK